jgi:hypothetical protein
MEKNQQILLGAAVLTIGGYLLWKSKQPKAAFMNASGCPAGMRREKNRNGVMVCTDGLRQIRTNMSGKKSLDGLKGLGKLTNRKRMVGANGKKKMVGMINSDKVQEGTFKNLINSTKVEDGSFKTFTPENLGSDLLSVKNSNFFDQNILGSKF